MSETKGLERIREEISYTHEYIKPVSCKIILAQLWSV